MRVCSRGFAVEFPPNFKIQNYQRADRLLAVDCLPPQTPPRCSLAMGIIDRVKEDFYQRICTEVSRESLRGSWLLKGCWFLKKAHHNKLPSVCLSLSLSLSRPSLSPSLSLPPLQHVLVLAALDVDSVCACKILQALFKADNVEHTLIPVAGKTELKKAYSEHSDQVR